MSFSLKAFKLGSFKLLRNEVCQLPDASKYALLKIKPKTTERIQNTSQARGPSARAG